MKRGARRAGVPFFRPNSPDAQLGTGDRIVFFTPYRETDADGSFVGHMDNAGGVAALSWDAQRSRSGAFPQRV